MIWQAFLTRRLDTRQIFKNTSEREREITPPTIHAVVSSVKLRWHLGTFNFIVKSSNYK